MNGVVLLIGPPGIGKSTLGQALVAQLGHRLCSMSLSFLSVGQVLRDEGLVDEYMRLDSTANLHQLQNRARSLMDEACCKLQVESAGAKAGSSSVLVCECVKELADAHSLLACLEDHDVPLLQVLLLSPGATRRCITPPQNVNVKSAAVCVSSRLGDALLRRNSERLVEQRQAKWAANAAPLIELFSSLGLLVEVDMYLQSEASGTDTLPAAAQLRPARPSPRGCLHGVTKVPGPRPGTLAALGYTTESGAASSSSMGAAGGAAGGGANSTWLQRAGWSGPDGRLFLTVQGLLVARAVPPVVSSRLVSSAAEKEKVLREAERSSGLRGLGQCIAVPSQVVATPGDASWVAYPGRYCVSRKCDGTRHLLLVASGGQAYLLNRAGALYRYPTQCSSSPEAVQSTEGRAQGAEASASPIALEAEEAGRALLPAGTVLDGELVWVGEATSGQRRGFFLAFDVLALGEQQPRAWSLLLDERLQLLSKLQEAEECPQLKAAAASLQAVGSTSTVSAADPVLAKQQQAAPSGQDSIFVLRKRHLPVSSESLLELQASSVGCPYPTDGLVFTPRGMPYVLGTAELLMKWQPCEQAAADVSGADLQGRCSLLIKPRAAALMPQLVYECLPQCKPVPASSSRAAQPRQELGPWVAVSVRWDKQRGNSLHSLEQMEAQRVKNRYGGGLSHEQLVLAVDGRQSGLMGPVAGTDGSSSSSSGVELLPEAAPQPQRHPARQLPFSDLYANILHQVQAGTVERTCDTATSGLEIFNYQKGQCEGPAGDVMAMSRGLVLHPPSCAVVATPFVKFSAGPTVVSGCAVCGCSAEVDAEGDHICGCDSCKDTSCTTVVSGCAVCGCSAEVDVEGDRICGCDSCKDTGCTGGTDGPSRLRKPRFQSLGGSESEDWVDNGSRVEECFAGAEVGQASIFSVGSSISSATVKVDGSLIIAFLWGGQLRTATRRRMDSEQALWASAWLHEHSEVQQFEPRWTYLFEAVYRENTVVVQYPFEMLVLLGAVSPEGVELTHVAALQQQARRLGVMAVPSLSGPHDELMQRLSRGCCGDAPTSACRQQRASTEGWVIMTAEGERYKLVQEAYKCASLAAKALHPLVVWDAVLCGASSRQLLDHLPSHLAGDALAVLDALGGSYSAVLQELQLQLGRAQEQGLAQRCSELAVTSQEADGGGSRLASWRHRPQQQQQQQQQHSSSLVELQGLMAGLSLAAPGDLGLSTGQEGSSSSSTAGNSSNTSAAFQAALRYVLLKGSCGTPSMYLDVKSLSSDAFWVGNGAAPHLRALVLQCIRPAADGALPGYLPSPSIRQTFAKGWAAGPQVGRLALTQRRSPLELLPDELLSHTLSMLKVPWHTVAAMLVCKAWRELLLRMPGIAERLEAGKAAKARERKRLLRLGRGRGRGDYGSSSGRRGGWSGEEEEEEFCWGRGFASHGYHGYGSS